MSNGIFTKEKAFKELKDEIAKRKIKLAEVFLDDTVHDVADGLASDINNEGIDSQMKFILEHWGVDGERKIREVLFEEA